MGKNNRTPKQILQEHKELYRVKIKKERRDFHKMDRENKENYGIKQVDISEWQIMCCREQIKVLQGHLREIMKRHSALKEVVEEGDFEGVERVVFGD